MLTTHFTRQYIIPPAAGETPGRVDIPLGYQGWLSAGQYFLNARLIASPADTRGGVFFFVSRKNNSDPPNAETLAGTASITFDSVYIDGNIYLRVENNEDSDAILDLSTISEQYF